MPKTNILLMLADDLNYNTVGCYGCPVDNLTPNLGRLSSEGIIFDHAHFTIAVCQPSRECLLTGIYPHRNGAPGFIPIADDIPTLTELLHNEGYLNGIVGKVAHNAPIEKYAWDYFGEMMDYKHGFGRSPY